jgi:hypothetical protein
MAEQSANIGDIVEVCEGPKRGRFGEIIGLVDSRTVLVRESGGDEYEIATGYLALYEKSDPLSPEAVIADPVGDKPGCLAVDTSKVYIFDRKEPIRVAVSFEELVDYIWPPHEAGGSVKAGGYLRFHRVTRDGIIDHNEVAIDVALIVSVASDRIDPRFDDAQ